MRGYLVEANHDLLYQIEAAQELLGAAQVPGELTPYLGEVALFCAGLRQQALRNLKDLDYGLEDTLGDILAATQNLAGLFDVLNARLASPIVRAKPADRLGLLFLRFLHDSNSKTNSLSFGFTDGNFAVYPTAKVPPIYLVPVTRQTTLLYLPLLFHEFGHVLYAQYKSELDDLVKDFQKVVARVLSPQTVRDKTATGKAASFRKQVVTAWYAWAQEFFCDAVGLTVGGPSFLKAFSHFFRTRSSDQYYLPRDQQLSRKHPVSWLRAKMLVDRARKFGFSELADGVEAAWNQTANAMGIQEDYEGTWADAFLPALRQMLDDMIEESLPYQHQPADVSPVDTGNLTPVQVCNLAWLKFEKEPEIYRSWERSAIEGILRSN